jgi:hypothetical protein
MKFRHGSASFSSEVAVSADEFWELLRNWPAVMKWHPKVDVPPLIACTLKEGNDPDTLPCTRLMHFATPDGGRASFEETLLYADPEARRIYYTFDGFRDQMRNYMATTIVEDAGPGRSCVTCSSSFDVPEGVSLEDHAAFLAAIYEKAVIRGIEAAAKREHQHGT